MLKVPFSRKFYKKTNFDTGGLLESDGKRDIFSDDLLLAPSRHTYPKELDFREMCLQASDQDQTPHCAGFSTAGYIEIKNWRSKHYPEQVDGDAIYVEAKKLDGRPNSAGTRMECAAQAALNLGLIDGDIKKVGRQIDDIKCAIHEHGSCVAGFRITNEWNMVNGYGIIRDLGDNAQSRGGHAVLICGYNRDGVFIQNSWGAKWALYGFALLSWKQVQSQFMGGVVIA